MKLCAIPKPKLLNTWSHVNAAMANFLTQWNSLRKQNIKENQARTKTTRSKSPRNTVPVVIENVDEENEDGLEEEGGCWSDVGKGRGNRRGRGQGANSGRGKEQGAGSRRGKGRDDPHQPSVKEFIPNPRARLAAGGWS